MKRELAPLVMFVYNRLDSVEQTVENLRKNELADQTDLFIFSDAAKKENQEENVKLVREYIHKIDGFNSVHILEAEKNKGLAKSVITGVTEIINERGKVIVVEDDLIAAPQFLSFMNAALDFYESEKRIWSISGYQFPFEMPETYTKTIYAAYRSSSWGWATWKDRWETIDWKIQDYDSYKYNLVKIAKFCRGGTDLDKMLRYQMKGKIDSWAIRWCYNQYKQDKLTIYPTKSLVNNIGTDGRGTHCDPTSRRFGTKLANNFEYSFEHGLLPENEIMKRYRKIVNRSIFRKAHSYIQSVIAKRKGLISC